MKLPKFFQKLYQRIDIPTCRAACAQGRSISRQEDQIIQFLTRHPVECGGRIYEITNIWNSTNIELERKHNYIQWLFPTDEPSNYNPNGPVLTHTDIQKIRENPRCRTNILKSLARMLRFYGFSFNRDMTISQTNPEKWPPTPHNFLRITRILKSLTLCGLGDTAIEFYNALMSIPNLKETVPQTTLDYWLSAVATNEGEWGTEECGTECNRDNIPNQNSAPDPLLAMWGM